MYVVIFANQDRVFQQLLMILQAGQLLNYKFYQLSYLQRITKEMHHNLNQSSFISKSGSSKNLHQKSNPAYSSLSTNQTHLHYLRSNNPFMRNNTYFGMEFENPHRNNQFKGKIERQVPRFRTIDNNYSRLAHVKSESDIDYMKKGNLNYDQNLYVCNKKAYESKPSTYFDYSDLVKSPYDKPNPFFTRANLTERIKTHNTSSFQANSQENSYQYNGYTSHMAHVEPYSRIIKELDKDLLRKEQQYQKQLSILQNYGPQALRYHPYFTKPIDAPCMQQTNLQLGKSFNNTRKKVKGRNSGNPQFIVYQNQNQNNDYEQIQQPQNDKYNRKRQPAKQSRLKLSQEVSVKNGQSKQTISSKKYSKKHIPSKSFVEVDYENEYQDQQSKPSIVKFEDVDQSNTINHRFSHNKQLNRNSQETPNFQDNYNFDGSIKIPNYQTYIERQYSNGRNMPFQSSAPQQQFGVVHYQVQQQSQDEYSVKKTNLFKIVRNSQSKYPNLRMQEAPESVQIKGKLYHLIKNRNQQY